MGCDLCGCYAPQLETFSSEFGRPFGQSISPHEQAWWNRFYAGVAEQFTHFGTMQMDGNEVANPTDQHLESSITQFVLGYSLTSRFALQINVPYIYRSFARPEGFTIDHGTESGLGDVSLLGKFVAFHINALARKETVSDGKNTTELTLEPELTASVVVLAGIKAPTGDSSRIKEEFNEVEIPGAPPSGIHGHDLTLGTGSWDGVFGLQNSLRYRRFFLQADAQFVLRGDGRHQYHFANDVSWTGGPGYYFVRTRSTILGLQFGVSGEHKDVDRFRGDKAEDTGITSVALGPRLVASRGKFSGEVGVEIPVLIDNTDLQLVPDYRLRAAFSVRF